MDIKQAEKIIHECGRVQVEVMQEVKTKYPTMIFPQSLLPYPKDKIRQAFETALAHTSDEKLKEAIQSSFVVLESCFIDDEEAKSKNSELLKASNIKFLELDGDIFRLSTIQDKLLLEIFDKPSSTFRTASEKFTGRDLHDAQTLQKEELPLEIRKILV